jgi:hypothetical protein
MSATLSAVLEEEAKKAAALRRVFSIRLGTVRARLLGLSREDERALRRAHLEEGVDWHEFGNGLCYSAKGLEKLERVIAEGLRTEGRGLSEEGSGPRGATGPTRPVLLLPEFVDAARGAAFLVRTMRCDFPNTQVVEVKMEGLRDEGGGLSGNGDGPRGATGPTSSERGFMRVRSSSNFLPGMLCWARLERGASVWVFCGRGDMAATETPVCPRARGRW